VVLIYVPTAAVVVDTVRDVPHVLVPGLYTWKLVGAVTVTLPEVRPYATSVAFCDTEKPDAAAENPNDEGDTLIVGGGVHVSTEFAAGVLARLVVKEVLAVADAVVGNVR
jgi:hypothetical protein